MPEFGIRSIADARDLRGARVIVRAGIDAPVSATGSVVDPFRIRQALPTLRFLRDAGARVVVVGHTSRADGSADASLRGICDVVSAVVPTTWVGALSLAEAAERSRALKPGELLMLENLRFDARETENNTTYAEELAACGDVYVNDAFSVSHREHASIVGVPQLLPSYAGLRFIEELRELAVARAPRMPSLLIVGGAKFETKIPIVRALLPHYDAVFIGGALAHDFYKQRGYDVGASLVSKIPPDLSALHMDDKLLLPIDVVAFSDRGTRITTPDAIAPDERIVDAGPATIALLESRATSSASVLWNGPVGDYEHGFAAGTRELAARIGAHAQAHTVVGGGDTIAAIADQSLLARFSFVSTAGGAMLAFLERGTLPGVEALRNRM